MLQYTSGSTGTPRGVVLSHGNLSANLNAIRLAYAFTESTRQVSWLPPYHDLGLIAGILTPVYCGYPTVLMSPLTFLSNPNRWLRALHHFEATVSGGPNFAYDLTVRKFDPDKHPELDLSHLEITINGAEPVRASTLARFHEAFTPYGLRDGVVRPCYGLAEATLMVSGGIRLGPRVCSVNRAALEKEHRVVEQTDGDADAVRQLVGCGEVAPTADVRIVDPVSRRERPTDGVGEIWVGEPSTSSGYWQKPDENAATFGGTLSDTGEAPFVRTGDLGFLLHDQLFICGRAKDVIIVRGRNHYPADIEQTVESCFEGFQRGASAVFQADVHGEEKVVVAQELRPGGERGLDADALYAQIREAVAAKHGVFVDELILLERRAIPKTSSGKISRSATRAAWLGKELLSIHTCRSDPRPTGAIDEPITDTEGYLVGVWKTILEVDVVERSSNFNALGGDSLGIVELAARLRDDLGLPVTPEFVLSRPTLADLASALDRKDLRPPTVDLDAEVRVGITEERVTAAVPVTASHGEIVLTGATGHLGIWLLHTLLTETDAKIHALVRGADEAAARARLRAALAARAIPDDGFDERVRVVPSDLERPRLGLSAAEFEDLGRQADTIYHCGAKVDWMATYLDLRAANVDGTREVLRLAVSGGTRSTVHYISTMWVLNPTPDVQVYDESRRAGWVGLENGYNRSKWVAEKLVLDACELGLRATIHRMDFIVGDREHGVCSADDFMMRAFTDMINTGHMPSEDAEIDLTEVDWLARCIVAVCRDPEAEGVYHHIAPDTHKLTLGGLHKHFGSLGYTVAAEPFDAWRERLEQRPEGALYPLRYFLELYSSAALLVIRSQQVVNPRTRTMLDRIAPGLAEDHPPMRDVVAASLRHLHGQELIPHPPRSNGESAS